MECQVGGTLWQGRANHLHTFDEQFPCDILPKFFTESIPLLQPRIEIPELPNEVCACVSAPHQQWGF
jgi:hypothetical protein